ncbi:MAG TPA: glycosyltransferase [Rhodanobacteraceae bacterium]|nr:glycosyltransferase [Rhodanobacteraceae bacterium]
MMRVLLPLHGYVHWNGGLDLARLLATALSRPTVSPKVELSFAIPKQSQANRWLESGLRWMRGLRTGDPRLAAKSASVRMRAAFEIAGEGQVIRCADNAGGILQAASLAHADIIFPTMLPLGPSDLRRVGYLFDFQHRYLPGLFPPRTCRNRDRRFAQIGSDGDGVVVNSRAVARDVEQWLGIAPDRILAMPFTPYAMPWSFDVDPTDAQRRYRIEGKYLMVCNHFWKHKDHATALRAFAKLRNSLANNDLLLILTGDPIDHRDPQHYAWLTALAERLGIAPSTRFLGLIPKRDQLALIRGCVGLLQPTLFEGGPGGGAVYDAIGLGVPAIVSDIPVNAEIDCGDVRFFHTGDAMDLADKTSELLGSPSPRPARDTLLSRGETNLKRLGNAIADFLADIVARPRTSSL